MSSDTGRRVGRCLEVNEIEYAAGGVEEEEKVRLFTIVILI